MPQSILTRPDDEFEIVYLELPNKEGWYWRGKPAGKPHGPFNTESAAFIEAHMEMVG